MRPSSTLNYFGKRNILKNEITKTPKQFNGETLKHFITPLKTVSSQNQNWESAQKQFLKQNSLNF